MINNILRPKGFVLDDSCKLWIPFHKYGLENTKLIDKSQYHNDGTRHGAIPGEKGWFFDGNGDYINVPQDTSLNVKNITMSAWINPLQQNLNDHIISKYANSSDCEYGLSITDEPGKKIKYFIRAGGTINIIAPSYTLTLGQWHHYVVTYDGTDIISYINGNLFNSIAHSVGGDIDNSNVNLYIGRIVNWYFHGQIGEVLIFNKGWTAEQIQSYFQITRHFYRV